MDQEVIRTAVVSGVLLFIGYSVTRFFSFMAKVEDRLRGIANLIDLNGDYLLEAVEDGNRHLAKMSKVVRVAAQENAVPETQEELNELKAEARKWLDEASVGQDTNKIISPDDLLL